MDARSFPKESYPYDPCDWNGECERENFEPVDCSTEGYQFGMIQCNTECQLDYTECGPAICQNSRLEADEQCDFFNSGASIDCGSRRDCTFCTSECVAVSVSECGNGVREATVEECDGDDWATAIVRGYPYTPVLVVLYDPATISCNGECQFVLDQALPATCGNYWLEGGETCEAEDERFRVVEGRRQECVNCVWVDSDTFCGDGIEQSALEQCDGNDFGDSIRNCRGYSSTVEQFRTDAEVVCTTDCLVDRQPCRDAELQIAADATSTDTVSADTNGPLESSGTADDEEEIDVGCRTARSVSPKPVTTAAMLAWLLFRYRRTRTGRPQRATN